MVSFFCFHSWEVCGKVGRNWNVTLGVKVPAECVKCGKRKNISATSVKDVPEDLITDSIQYFL